MASGLTDMEELLGRVPGADTKGFMREALVCYGAGAHRACIVLAFIAVFEDLRQKVRIAAPLNKDAKAISTDVETLAAGQKPFETDLVNRMQAKKLLTTLQAKQLTQMIDHRNKAAHPSGHHASAEEARFVYYQAIVEFLSKPLLGAKGVADVLLERLTEANFFPNSTLSTIKVAVSDEIDQLNPAAYLYLVSKLVDLVTDTDSTVSGNAKIFLTGMAALRRPELREQIAKILVKSKAASIAYRVPIVEAISADAKVLKGADATTQGRVKALLSQTITATDASVSVAKLVHPVSALRSILRDLEPTEISPSYDDFIVEVAKTFWASPELTYGLKLGSPARSVILTELMQRAGSSDFGTANSFARLLPDLQQRLAEELEPAEVLALLAAISQAADWGAWAASALRSNKFASVPNLRHVATDFIDKFPTEASVALGDKSTPENFKAQHLITEPTGDALD